MATDDWLAILSGDDGAAAFALSLALVLVSVLMIAIVGAQRRRRVAEATGETPAAGRPSRARRHRLLR